MSAWGDIMTRLVQIEGTIAGVTRVYSEIPRVLSSRAADLPCIVNFFGANERERGGGDNVTDNRTIDIHLYFAPADGGKAGEIEARLFTADIIDAVEAAFDARPRLQYGDGGIVRSAILEGDGGLQSIAYPIDGTPYLGVVFTLRIWRTRHIAPV